MTYKTKKEAIILLEDGTIFKGKSIGIKGTATGEICFNTGMTGYQEIFTDPSYYGQIMVATNAHIGNYGVNEDEVESDGVKIAALICRNFSFNYSRFNASGSLKEWFEKHNLVALTDVDTRAFVTYIREKGAMNAIVSTETDDLLVLKEKLAKVPSMEGLELASTVSTKVAYEVGDSNSEFRIAAIDLGIKKNIIRNFVSRGALVKVFPYNVCFEEVEQFKPHGYFLSNGPGDPQPLKEVQELAKKMLNNDKPVFGICLGHQIIALIHGVSTYKMHNGHRGINHPVKNLLTNKGEITSQNHGFAINREEAEKHPDIEITHVHLNDNSVAGIRLKNKPCFSVQYHPEASPGPHDSSYLFDDFIDQIKQYKLQEV